MEAQAQIISRGMRWTPEMFKRAEKGQFYYKIGDKGGQLLISGAQARWKRPEFAEYIYIPSLRVSGKPEDLYKLLQSVVQNESKIREYLSSSYTSSNVSVPQKNGGMMEQFEAEVSEFGKFRETQSTTKEPGSNSGINLVMLDSLIGSLDHAEAIRKSRPVKQAPIPNAAGTGQVLQPKRAGRRLPFSTRIHNLRNGQVLDVTNMREDGTGAKVILQPGPNSGKIGCSLVSGIVSSNLETFRMALTQLELSSEQQQQCLAQWQANRLTNTTSGTTSSQGTVSSQGTSSTTTAKPRGRRSAQKPVTKSSIVMPTSTSTTMSMPTSTMPTIPSIPTLLSKPQSSQASPRSKVVSPMMPSMPNMSTTAPTATSSIAKFPTLSSGKKSPMRTPFSGGNLPVLPSMTSPRAMGH